jgi:hypothetical protein
MCQKHLLDWAEGLEGGIPWDKLCEDLRGLDLMQLAEKDPTAVHLSGAFADLLKQKLAECKAEWGMKPSQIAVFMELLSLQAAKSGHWHLSKTLGPAEEKSKGPKEPKRPKEPKWLKGPRRRSHSVPGPAETARQKASEELHQQARMRSVDDPLDPPARLPE